MALTVYNPAAATNPDGANLTNNLAGKQGEQLNADLHGKWFNANMRRGLYTFVSENATLSNVGVGGVATNGIVSVFVLQNPAGSNVNAEIISAQYGHNNATTVVGSIGWYQMPATSTQSATAVTPTFATRATAGTNYFSGRIGDTPNGAVVPWTSVTYTTTGGGLIALKIDSVANVGAATDSALTVADKQYEGRMILPPGQTILLGASTAAMPSSNLQVTWAEWPFA